MAIGIPSQGQGKRSRLESSDRISGLPGEVIHEILIHLPIRDAVKTSLLSKGWRYTWTSMPNLVFDFGTRSVLPSSATQQVNFVHRVFLFHRGNVFMFRLNYFLDSGCSDVDHWILVLSRVPLNHLALYFTRPNPYQLPACLFSCQALRSLELEHCTLRLPSHYNGFASLTYLELRNVILGNATFESLLAKTPFLRILKVLNCKPLTHFNIHGQKLELVCASGSCETFNVLNAPNIKRLCIAFDTRYKLDEVLHGLDTLRCIRISRPFLEISPIDDGRKKLEVTCNHLEYVDVWVQMEDYEQILAVLCLCRRSPNLKILQIQNLGSMIAVLSRVPLLWKAPVQEEYAFHHLKTVKLLNFKGVKQELEVTKLILLKASLLEAFWIHWDKRVVIDKRLDVVEKMMQFRRASPKAEVFFK